MRRGALAVTVGLAMCLGLAPAHAEPSTTDLTIVDVDTSTHPAVSLVVTAPAELADSDLDALAFSLSENGRGRPLQVERVATEGLEVVVVIDASGSMQGAAIDAARAAAAGFVQTLPAGTEVSVIAFGATPRIAHAFSTDTGSLVASIGAITPGGETALYDALVTAGTLPEVEGTNRRAVVVLSDGGDTASAASLDDALQALGTSASMTSVVELVTAESDSATLARIAEAATGRVVPVDDPDQLNAAFDDVRADLVGRYLLRYESLGDGTADLTVRLRSGSGALEASAVVELPTLSAAPSAVAPRVEVAARVADGSRFGETTFLAGVTLVGAALFVLGLALARPRRRSVRLRTEQVGDGATSVARLASRATLVAERTLARSNGWRSIETLLAQAGIALRAAEVLVIVAVGSAMLLLLAAAVFHPLVGFTAALVPPLLVRPVLTHRIARRQRAFADQLDTVLQMVAGGLRAGYGLMQAMETSGRELPAPAGEELRRYTAEVRLGRDSIDALDAMASRVGSEDFAWVARAIRIHREVGGDLAEVLDRVSDTIRDRGRLERQVRALSAEGRISAYVLLALPVVLAAALSLMNPGFMTPLVTTKPGMAMLGLSIVLMTTGSLWLRRLIRPVF